MLHVISARCVAHDLRRGHVSVHVGGSSRRNEKISKISHALFSVIVIIIIVISAVVDAAVVIIMIAVAASTGLRVPKGECT